MDGVANQGYRKLEVWRDGMSLALEIYEVTQVFPQEEKFGLVQQMRRCAVSVPSNLAEGHARGTPRDFGRFVSIAMGSLAELETQLLLSRELGLLGSSVSILEKCDSLGKRLRKLHQYLLSQ